MRKLLPVVLVVALGSLAAYLAMTAGDGPEGDLPGAAEARDVEPGTASAPASVPGTAGGTAARERVEAETPVAEEDAAAAPPLSYRQALGGLLGRIVERDGSPVGGIAVDLYGVDAGALEFDAAFLFGGGAPQPEAHQGGRLTDEEGRFHFSDIEPGSFLVLGIDLVGPRTTARFVDHAPGAAEMVDLGDIVLAPGMRVTGTVKDDEDAPVAGARVRAMALPPLVLSLGLHRVGPATEVAFKSHGQDRWQVWDLPDWLAELIDVMPVPEARTDAAGRFEFAALPAGQTTFAVDARGLAPRVQGPLGLAGDTQDVGVIRLETGETLEGRVVDAAGDPVEGVEILVGKRSELTGLALVEPVGLSDADGRFFAAGLEDGEHVVAALAEGAIDWEVVEGLEPGIDRALVRLPTAYDLVVNARDARGRPVDGVEFLLQLDLDMAESPMMAPPIPLAPRTSRREDGAYLIAGLGARSYTLLVWAPEFAAASAAVDLSAGPATVQITLEGAQALGVTVVEDGGGEPVAYARVTAHTGDSDHGGERFTPLAAARTDAAGRALLESLPAGDLILRVEHPEYAGVVKPVTVPAVAVTVALDRGGGLVGRVHRGGRPPDAPRFVTIAEREGGALPRFVITDAAGRFEANRLRPGEVTVEVWRRFAGEVQGLDLFSQLYSLSTAAEARRDVPIQAGMETEVEIDLLGTVAEGPLASLKGQVMVNGLPAADYVVLMSPFSGWEQRKSTSTDAGGRFDFGTVPAGAMWLQVDRPGRSAEMPVPGVQSLATRTIELAEGEAREERFEFDLGSLTGKVVADQSGQPVPGSGVALASRSGDATAGLSVSFANLSTICGPDGAFHFDAVPAGSYTVMAEAEGYARASLGPVLVPARGAPPPVLVRLEHGVTVEGVVRLPAGAEVDSLFLWVEPEGTGSFAESADVSEESGAFRLARLAPGRYTVHVASDQEAYEDSTLVVPKEGVKGLVLELRRVARDPSPPGGDAGQEDDG